MNGNQVPQAKERKTIAMDEGCTCTDCGEWFEVVFNNNPGNELRFCPLCGYKFSEKDLDYMFKEQDDEASG